jgi:hypothetical protein
MKVNDFLDQNANALVNKMETEFDSHKFIKELINSHEKVYVELLYGYVNNAGIFQTLHAQIGRYLSDNSKRLNIEKLNRDSSENIKGYESENQTWKRIL